MGQVLDTVITFGGEYLFNGDATAYQSVAALTDDKFVVVYQDGGNADRGTARVGTVSGLTITFGAELLFNNAQTTYPSITALTSTSFIVAYHDAGGSGNGLVRLGIVSGYGIAYSSDFAFNLGSSSYISAIKLSTTKFAVAYQDLGNSSYGTVRLGEVSGYLINYGIEYEFNEAVTSDIAAAALTSAYFVVAYRDGGYSNYGTARLGIVTGTTVSYGAEHTFNTAGTKLFHSGGVAALSPMAFIVGYENEGDSNGRVIMGLVDGSDLIFGNSVPYSGGAQSSDITVLALGQSKYIIAWSDQSKDDYGKAKVSTLPAFGLPYLLNPVHPNGYIAVARLAPDRFILTYEDQDNSNYGTVVVGEVSGSTITYGPQAVYNYASTVVGPVCALSGSTFVVAYRDAGNSNYGTARVGQISGLTISLGSEYVFKESTIGLLQVITLSNDTFVLAYKDSDASDYGKSIVGQVSGLEISYGNEYTFNEEDTSDLAITRLTDRKFILAWRDTNTTGYGKSIVGMTAGTVISFGSETTFNDGLTGRIDVQSLSSDQIVVTYRDVNNAGYGTIRVADVASFSFTYGSEFTFSTDPVTILDIGIARLSPSAFVIGYCHDSNDGLAIVGALQGKAVVFGHQVPFNRGDGATSIAIDALSDHKFVTAWPDPSNSNTATVKVSSLPASFKIYLPLVIAMN